jgi:GH24 family phage-related lysozyme (muramidase)
MAMSAAGQTSPATSRKVQEQLQLSAPAAPSAAQFDPSATPVTRAAEQLLGFTDSDVKFDLRDLMEILRDRRHEGWVLAAYPDPKTGRPLIGAGFSLDLPAREHPQRDQLNPHPFLEPSSAELWQAAGLDSERLQTILDQFNDRLAAWTRKGFRQRIKTLTPQITDEEATLLLRVSAIQAIYNAKGYFRDFDQLTPSQQMALSQMVYQMGVNLQEFSQFLNLINNSHRTDTGAAPLLHAAIAADAEYWKTVQQSLLQSQWARLYRVRAVSVIAMLDPQYLNEPGIAERRVGAMLRPAVAHRRTGQSVASDQLASHPGRSSKGRSGSTARRATIRQKRKRGI